MILDSEKLKNQLLSKRLEKTLRVILRNRRIAIDGSTADKLIKAIKKYSPEENIDRFSKELAKKVGIEFERWNREASGYEEAQSLEDFIKSGRRKDVADFVEAFYYVVEDKRKVDFSREIQEILASAPKSDPKYAYLTALPFSLWLINMDELMAEALMQPMFAIERLEEELKELRELKELEAVDLRKLAEQVGDLRRELQSKTPDFRGALDRLREVTASLGGAVSSLKIATGRANAIAQTLSYIRQMADAPQADADIEEVLTHLRVTLLLQALLFLTTLIQPNDPQSSPQENPPIL